MEVETNVLAIDMNGGDIIKGVGPVERISKSIKLFQQQHSDITLICYGNEENIKDSFYRDHINNSKIEIVNAPSYFKGIRQVEGMVKDRSQTSLVKLLEDLKDNNNKVNAAFSCGETASLVFYSTHHLRIIEGLKIKIPPLIAQIWTKGDNTFLFADAGATIETRSEEAYTYALLCDLYSRKVLGVKTPRVAILSNGTEKTKGNEFVKSLDLLLSESKLNYVGRIEGKHGIFENNADVVITDGFTGNIALKNIEGVVVGIKSLIKEKYHPKKIIQRSMKNPLALFDLLGIMSFYLSGTYKEIGHELSVDRRNGAPLLGLNGYVVKGHGNSSVEGIYHGLEITLKYANSGIIDSIKKEIIR